MKFPAPENKDEIKKIFDDVVALSPYLDSSIKNPSIEIKKTEEALKDLQQKVAENPEILKEELINHLTTFGFSKEKADRFAATWSNERAQKYINEFTKQDNQPLSNTDLSARKEKFEKTSNHIDEVAELLIKSEFNENTNIEYIHELFGQVKKINSDFTKTNIQEVIFLLERHLTKTKNEKKAQYLKKWIELSKVWQQEVAPNPKDNEILDLNDLANISYSFSREELIT